MTTASATQPYSVVVPGAHLMGALVGPHDAHLRLIERSFPNATVVARGNEIHVVGEQAAVVGRLCEELVTLLQRGQQLDESSVKRAIDMVREERLDEVEERAEQQAEERLLDLLMPAEPEEGETLEKTRDKLRERLRAGKLDDRQVEVDVRDRGPSLEISTPNGLEEMDATNLKDVLPGLFGPRTKKRKMRVAEAYDYFIQEEEQKLIDMDEVVREAINKVEQTGIVFLDEIDKVCARSEASARASKGPRRWVVTMTVNRGDMPSAPRWPAGLDCSSLPRRAQWEGWGRPRRWRR